MGSSTSASPSTAFFQGARQPTWFGFIVGTLLHFLFHSGASDVSPNIFWVVIIETTWWCHHPWCAVKNAFGTSVYSKEYAFPISLLLLLLFTMNVLSSGWKCSSEYYQVRSNYNFRNNLKTIWTKYYRFKYFVKYNVLYKFWWTIFARIKKVWHHDSLCTLFNKTKVCDGQ
jgi:hypothetical protein